MTINGFRASRAAEVVATCVAAGVYEVEAAADRTWARVRVLRGEELGTQCARGARSLTREEAPTMYGVSQSKVSHEPRRMARSGPKQDKKTAILRDTLQVKVKDARSRICQVKDMPRLAAICSDEQCLKLHAHTW